MEIILGTANFNSFYGLRKKKINKSKIKEVTKYLILKKINRLDTALVYNNEVYNSKKIFLIDTKINFDVNFKNKINYFHSLKKKLKKDLTKYSIKSFNTVYIHNIHDFKSQNSFEIIFQNLNKFKKQKVCKKIGISFYETKNFKRIIKIIKPDVVQIPINIIDRRFEKFLIFLKKKNIEVVARSIFLQGILLEEGLEFKKKFLIFDQIDKWIKINKTDPLNMCISYIKSLSNLDAFIVGIDNLIQLKAIIKAKKNKRITFPRKIKSNNMKLIDPRKW